MRSLAVSCVLVACVAVNAQIEQIATSGDGAVLLFHSRFRLQGETDMGAQGKIYRLQAGQWTRLAAATERPNWISTPDVSDPFISADGAVFGWQTHAGCSLCQIIVGPEDSSVVAGVDLPSGFLRGTLRMSAHGRYFTGDNYPFPGVKYLDAITGAVADVPVDVSARPPVREVADDGTALLLITAPNDPNQHSSPGALSLWKPGGDPRPIYSETRVFTPTISASGGKVAFEAVAADGGRTLIVIDANTGDRFPVASMPAADVRAGVAMPSWDANGTQLLYRGFDDNGRPTKLSVWDAATASSRVLLASDEGFYAGAISGDGAIVWAVTSVNRLLRINVSSGVVDEILPPLGSPANAVSDQTAGSAVLIPGVGSASTRTVLDGDVQLPIVAAEADGLWVQIPWEYAGSARATHKLLIRSENNPFEAVVNVAVAPDPHPYFAKRTDPATGAQYVKAAHDDWHGLVTPADPARPGEVIHAYLTGLGALDGAAETGAPGPAQPLLRPVAPMRFWIQVDGSAPETVQALDVTYVPGLVGFYQANLVVPDDVPDGAPVLYCTVAPPNGDVHSASGRLSTSVTR